MTQALYRKYRSKSLKQIVGQEHITVTIQNALDNKNINHAYLLTGPRGVGKTSIARILAHEINELPYNDEAGHLDIIEIDAASNRRIDDIRDLREKVHIAPVSAKFKVYIIDEVHMLTGESFNALLKTLEEPPAHVVFILATTEMHKLPATIISRTQRFHFRPVDKLKVMKHLKNLSEKENILIDEKTLHIIAEYGEGSLRDSISLLDQLASMSNKNVKSGFAEEVLGLAGHNYIDEISDYIQGGKVKKLHNLLDKMELSGINAVTLSSQLIRRFRELAYENPKFYEIIDNLMLVGKHSYPWLKLLIILLRAATNFEIADTSSEQLPTKNEHKNRTNKPAATTNSDLRLVISVDPTSENKNIDKNLNKVSAKYNIRKLSDWHDILRHISKKHPPILGILSKVEPRFDSDKLVLAVKYKLHKNKLNDVKWRSKIMDCIVEAGFNCPTIEVLHDPKVQFRDQLNHKHTEGSDTQTILSMMGGGEILNGQNI